MQCVAITSGSKLRAGTVGLYLWSKMSGMGKTTLMSLLAAVLFPESGDQARYVRGQTKHWDGYAGQPLVVIDEFDALVAKYSEAPFRQEILNLISNQTVYVSMADLSDKGMVFVSKLLVALSNKPLTMKREEYAHQAALTRRFVDNAYEIVGHSDYLRKDNKNKLDWAKINALSKEESVNVPWMKFIRQSDKKVVSFGHVVLRLREELEAADVEFKKRQQSRLTLSLATSMLRP